MAEDTGNPSASEANPLAIVLGGLALGAAVGAVLPRPQREKDALAPLGRKLAERANAAVSAAREAGRAEIEGLLPAREQAKERVTQAFGNILEAAKGAGQA
jgi:hypothetical protein